MNNVPVEAAILIHTQHLGCNSQSHKEKIQEQRSEGEGMKNFLLFLFFFLFWWVPPTYKSTVRPSFARRNAITSHTDSERQECDDKQKGE